MKIYEYDRELGEIVSRRQQTTLTLTQLLESCRNTIKTMNDVLILSSFLKIKGDSRSARPGYSFLGIVAETLINHDYPLHIDEEYASTRIAAYSVSSSERMVNDEQFVYLIKNVSFGGNIRIRDVGEDQYVSDLQGFLGHIQERIGQIARINDSMLKWDSYVFQSFFSTLDFWVRLNGLGFIPIELDV